MARRVDSLPNHPGRGNSLYPWKEWLDGSVWELIPGKDFDCKVVPFRSIARTAALARGLTVTTQVHDGHVYLQARNGEAAINGSIPVTSGN